MSLVCIYVCTYVQGWLVKIEQSMWDSMVKTNYPTFIMHWPTMSLYLQLGPCEIPLPPRSQLVLSLQSPCYGKYIVASSQIHFSVSCHPLTADTWQWGELSFTSFQPLHPRLSWVFGIGDVLQNISAGIWHPIDTYESLQSFPSSVKRRCYERDEGYFYPCM